MASDTAPSALEAAPALPHRPMPPQNLRSSDGVQLETPWHRAAMNLLIDQVAYQFRDRNDFFAGGDMVLYFSERADRAEAELENLRRELAALRGGKPT